MKNTQYITIQGWMINELKLKSNDLIIYSIVYGFSQDGESDFRGSLDYLINSTNTSKPTVLKSLKFLVEKQLITKEKVSMGKQHCCIYKSDLNKVKNLYLQSKETLPDGSQETLPNTITTNTINNKERETKFLDLFNKTKTDFGLKSSVKVLSKTDKSNLSQLTGYKVTDFIIAIQQMLKNDWCKTTGNQTPSHVLRIENFNRYLSQGQNHVIKHNETIQERQERLLNQTKDQ